MHLLARGRLAGGERVAKAADQQPGVLQVAELLLRQSGIVELLPLPLRQFSRSDRGAVSAALLGAGIAIALTPFTPPGVPIIAASAAALIGLLDR